MVILLKHLVHVFGIYASGVISSCRDPGVTKSTGNTTALSTIIDCLNVFRSRPCHAGAVSIGAYIYCTLYLNNIIT